MKLAKLIISICIVGFLGIYLISSFAGKLLQYDLTVDQALTAQSKHPKSTYRVVGVIDHKSVQWLPNNNPITLEFKLESKDHSGEYMHVIYHDVKPPDFDKSGEAIVKGKFDSNGNTFFASEILLKCPSKYRSKD